MSTKVVIMIPYAACNPEHAKVLLRTLDEAEDLASHVRWLLLYLAHANLGSDNSRIVIQIM
jgi:hypothetical protein